MQIACDKKDPRSHALVLPFDVRITWSGTFLHYSTDDNEYAGDDVPRSEWPPGSGMKQLNTHT